MRPSQQTIRVVAERIPDKMPPLLMIGEEGFCINPAEWATCGDRDAILASSGFGKSYLAGVMTEQLLECGGQVFIIDPEGENYTLAKRYPMLIVGGEHKTVELDLDAADQEDIDKVVKTVLYKGISVIWDLSDHTQTRQRELFAMIGASLFANQDKELGRPVKFIVEEARVFAPQNASKLPIVNGKTCLSVFEDIATRGRKRGINFLIATQRPASINKNILSQCNRWWFGGMQSTQDCKALKPYLADAGVTEDEIRNLPKGEGWFYYHANGQTHKVKTRKRKCKHGGSTPAVQAQAKPASKTDVAAAISVLNKNT